MRFAPITRLDSKPALYFLTAFTAALLFILLTNSDDASAQQAATATPIPTASGPDFPPIPPKRTPQLGNLDSMLSQLAARVQNGYSTAHDAASQAPIHADDSVAVTFYLIGDTAPLLAFLRANGGDARNIGDDYVEAYVPVALLAEASEQPNVVRVQAIIPPQPARGDVTSQGVGAHAANAWHTAGYTGTGVKVGIIDTGFEGFNALMGSELPANVTARCYTDIGVFTSNLADCENDRTHGTSVSETMLDIAPNATLYIANPISWSDLRSAVDWLVSQDVDVINHSISRVWGGPGNGTSPYSNSPLRSVDTAVNSGAMWANSAGNRATATWFGAFSDPNSNRYMNFRGSIDYNAVDLEAGETFQAQLRWEGNWLGAQRDLDLLLVDSTGEFVAFSEYRQRGIVGDVPFEFMEYTPTISGTYYLYVQLHSGDLPGWVQLQSFTGETLQFYTERGSIGSPAESANPGMLAVGAAHYWDVNIIASYSSRGATPDGRTKPDIVGAACAATATQGAGRTLTSGQRYWFCGTSQASAHIAGLAALVKQRFPDYTPAQIASYLKSNAEPRGAVPNNDWGYGFAKLPNPTDSGETPPEPTPIGTPSPTPTGTSGAVSPTPTATSTTVPTPVSGDLDGRMRALEDIVRRLESLMLAFESRLSALEGGATVPTPTATPSPTPTRVSGTETETFTFISTGHYSTCGLRADGTATCWGYYSLTPPAGETFTSISAGGPNACALRADGSAVCWGPDQLTPPAGETFVSIGASFDFACGLRADGTVACWGNNEYGQSSPPAGETFASISVTHYDACGLRENGEPVCWGYREEQSVPPVGETFASISAGGHHACGLRENGTVVCWSYVNYATSPPWGVFTSLSAGTYHSCALREDGTAVCWGLDYGGSTSPPSGAFTSLSSGGSGGLHTCGLRADGVAVCWGDQTP